MNCWKRESFELYIEPTDKVPVCDGRLSEASSYSATLGQEEIDHIFFRHSPEAREHPANQTDLGVLCVYERPG